MKKLLMVAGLSLVLVGAGCSGSATPSAGGGVYGTTDGGRTWVAMNALPLTTGVSSINGADITSLTSDPSNANIIYAGTKANGLLMSFDGAKSWQQPPNEKAFELVRTGAVLDVAIDAQHPCTWYILKSDRLIKTDTCGRSYNLTTYQEGRASEQLTALALDWYNPSIVWLGTTAGDVFESADGGATWTNAIKVKADVSAIEVTHPDSRVVLVGTTKRSLVRTTDGGATWTELEDNFKKYSKANYVRSFAGTTDGKTVLMNTDYGPWFSNDVGATWLPLKVITAAGEVKATAIGVAPKNGNVIVYGSSSTLYRTINGGQAWTTTDLPTTRAASAILFTSDSETNMLLGVVAPVKK